MLKQLIFGYSAPAEDSGLKQSMWFGLYPDPFMWVAGKLSQSLFSFAHLSLVKSMSHSADATDVCAVRAR